MAPPARATVVVTPKGAGAAAKVFGVSPILFLMAGARLRARPFGSSVACPHPGGLLVVPEGSAFVSKGSGVSRGEGARSMAI